MKALFLSLAIAAAPLFGANMVSAQNPFAKQHFTGVGPVISASSQIEKLPEQAKKFLDKHFKGQAIRSVERDFNNMSYDVELADGTDVDFSPEGEAIEIDAPNGYVLSESVLKAFLPHKTMELLNNRKISGMVESVKKVKDGYFVDFTGADDPQFVFNKSGDLSSIAFDED